MGHRPSHPHSSNDLVKENLGKERGGGGASGSLMVGGKKGNRREEKREVYGGTGGAPLLEDWGFELLESGIWGAYL